MPARVSRVRRRMSGALPYGVAEFLLGSSRIQLAIELRLHVPSTLAALREFAVGTWLAHEAHLLPAWIDVAPGSRPWAWWLANAPQHFGLDKRERHEAAESERAFLARHDLLTDEELEHATPGPYADDRRPRWQHFDTVRAVLALAGFDDPRPWIPVVPTAASHAPGANHVLP